MIPTFSLSTDVIITIDFESQIMIALPEKKKERHIR